MLCYNNCVAVPVNSAMSIRSTPPELTEAALLAQPDDAYMDAAQQGFFRELLMRQRSELQLRIDGEVGELRQAERAADEVDLASGEEQRQWQLRLLEREKKLLDKIDQALQRLARGEYGWCSETGEPIGLPRLLLRPTTDLCIEAKEREEQRERHHRNA